MLDPTQLVPPTPHGLQHPVLLAVLLAVLPVAGPGLVTYHLRSGRDLWRRFRLRPSDEEPR